MKPSVSARNLTPTSTELTSAPMALAGAADGAKMVHGQDGAACACTGVGVAKHDVHVVQPRDTVSSIAKLYGVSIKDVVRWNNLENGDAIHPGDRLRVTAMRPSVERDGQGGFR